MNQMDINLASNNDMRLQSNFTNLNQNQYSTSSSTSTTTTTASNDNNNSTNELAYSQYGDDGMIGLVLGDLDFLNLIVENEQQQQQTQTIQSNLYHIPQQQQQIQVNSNYQAQAQMQQTQQSPVQAQQPAMNSGNFNSCNMTGTNLNGASGGMNRGLSGVNLLDLHDEQSERIKSEVIDMNILNLMPPSAGSSSNMNVTPAYLPQLSMGSTSTMLDSMSQLSGSVSSLSDQQSVAQLDPNFDFIFPDKSSKEILECLINDETDMFDSLFAPRIDYVNTNYNNTNNASVNNANTTDTVINQPLRSISSQLGELFRLDSTGELNTAIHPPQTLSRSTMMPAAPSKGKGKGKFLKAESMSGINPRTSARLQSKRILNCTKSEPMEPTEPVMMSSNLTSMPSLNNQYQQQQQQQQQQSSMMRMPGKLENYSMMNNSMPARNTMTPYKRKRSYEDDDQSDDEDASSLYHPRIKGHSSSSRETSHMNSMENSMDVDAENQMLLEQSSHLLAALQRQSRLTGNKRLSSNMKEIEKELKVLETIKSPSGSSVASKVVPSMPASMTESRRSSLHSTDYQNQLDDENEPMKKDSNKDAAFRYRLKKLSEKDRLFETREHLERENGEVKRRIELAQAEISYLKTLLVQMLLNKGYLDSSRVVS